jgi:asparagine synthase (glutamine-hydrolysing)
MQRDPMFRERVHAGLTSLAQRGIVQPQIVAKLLEQHRTEHAVYYGSLLWPLFMLEEWLTSRRAP